MHLGCDLLVVHGTHLPISKLVKVGELAIGLGHHRRAGRPTAAKALAKTKNLATAAGRRAWNIGSAHGRRWTVRAGQGAGRIAGRRSLVVATTRASGSILLILCP